jgi:hypothetical protein
MQNALSLTEQQDLQIELANCRERLAEARNEAWIHRQNWEAAIRLLAAFAPPDWTELIVDKLMLDWLEATT